MNDFLPSARYEFRLTPDGAMRLPAATANIEKIYGYSADALAEDFSLVWQLVHPDDQAILQARIEASARRLDRFHYEWRLLHPRKGEIWVEASSRPQRLADGSTAWRGSICDVTEYKRLSTKPARAQLARELKHAFEQGELALHYLPRENLRTGRLSAAEATPHWHHLDYGFIAPAELMLLADHCGLGFTISDWLLRTACAQAAQNDSDFPISVKLTWRQFDKRDLDKRVAQHLKEAGCVPSQLELVVSENLIMTTPEHVIPQLERLHSMGVQLALRDLGTDCCSLDYLKRLHVTRLVADETVISGLPEDAHSQALLKDVVALASRLGLAVAAEGVANERQRQLLAELGCHEVQGCVVSRPVTWGSLQAMRATLRCLGGR